jgi:hypothetical protein
MDPRASSTAGPNVGPEAHRCFKRGNGLGIPLIVIPIDLLEDTSWVCACNPVNNPLKNTVCHKNHKRGDEVADTSHGLNRLSTLVFGTAQTTHGHFIRQDVFCCRNESHMKEDQFHLHVKIIGKAGYNDDDWSAVNAFFKDKNKDLVQYLTENLWCGLG